MVGKLNNRNKKSIPQKPLSGYVEYRLPATHSPPEILLSVLCFSCFLSHFSLFSFFFFFHSKPPLLKTSPLLLLLKSLFSIKSSSPSHFPPVRIFLFPCNNPISHDATRVPMVRFPSFHLLFQYFFFKTLLFRVNIQSLYFSKAKYVISSPNMQTVS